jgi:hypothetical protein
LADSSKDAAGAAAGQRMPEHGFARRLAWAVDERQSAVQPDGCALLLLLFLLLGCLLVTRARGASQTVETVRLYAPPRLRCACSRSVHLVLALQDSSFTRDDFGWPHAFALEYSVKLTGRSLQASLTVTNPRLVEWVQGFQVLMIRKRRRGGRLC